jgi:hypothetical protein
MKMECRFITVLKPVTINFDQFIQILEELNASLHEKAVFEVDQSHAIQLSLTYF